jgi:pimeloyl-ACP methyl ester carboxylesterase
VTEVQLNAMRMGTAGKPPLLMLHGWGQNLRSLQPLGELLADVADIHILDLPGFGKSSPPPEDWDTWQYADRVRAYMADNSIDRADFLGHSFGGRVSIRLASRYPQQVRSITLINAGGLQRRLTWQQSLRSRWIKTQRTAFKLSPLNRQALLDWHSQKYGSRDYLNAGNMRGTLVKTVSEDVTDVAAKITAPALILWGEADTETPVEMAHRYHQLLRNSQMVTLPRRDHFMFQGNSCPLCAFYIIRFFSELNTGVDAAKLVEVSSR